MLNVVSKRRLCKNTDEVQVDMSGVKSAKNIWLPSIVKPCSEFDHINDRMNVVQDPFIALSIYRARNSVEQSFQQFKNQTAGDRLYATSSTYMGKLFVQVLAQSLRLMMRMAGRRNKTATKRLPNNSLTKAFLLLRYLKANKATDRNARGKNRSRRKSEISLPS